MNVYPETFSNRIEPETFIARVLLLPCWPLSIFFPLCRLWRTLLPSVWLSITPINPQSCSTRLLEQPSKTEEAEPPGKDTSWLREELCSPSKCVPSFYTQTLQHRGRERWGGTSRALPTLPHCPFALGESSISACAFPENEAVVGFISRFLLLEDTVLKEMKCGKFTTVKENFLFVSALYPSWAADTLDHLVDCGESGSPWQLPWSQ